MPIIKEVETVEDGKYIYLGNTFAANTAEVAPTFDEVQYNGFEIATKAQNIYLRGYSEIGTRNAVYQFLEDNFAYECYAVDEIALDEKESVIISADYDKVVTPSFDWRQANYGELVYEDGVITNTTLSKRMRFNHADEIFVQGHLCHNSFTLVNPETYYESHPEWFYTKDGENAPTQLCYSKAISDEEMFAVYLENTKKYIQKNKRPNMYVGIEDDWGWCDCNDCTSSYNTYQSHSAIMIQFVNKAQQAIDDWFEVDYPEEQPTRLVFFAYHDTVEPPVKTGDESKDALIMLNKNSSVMFAPIQARYDIPYTEQEVVSQIAGWKQVADNIYAWTYSLLMNSGLLFSNTIDSMLSNYQCLSENGVTMILDQTEHYQKYGNSGFSRLKMFLMSKAQWNCNMTETELANLTTEFFEHYFGEASAVMQSLYEAEKGQLAIIHQTSSGTIGEDLLSTDYWSKDVLVGYLELIEEAYSAIEGLKTSDAERYNQLYNRILLESMQFRYLMLNLYPDYYGEELQTARTVFQEDFETLRLTRFAETESEDEKIKKKMDFYLTETLQVQLSTASSCQIWEDKTFVLPIANHSGLSVNADSIYVTTTSWVQFYGDIIIDDVMHKKIRFDIPPGTGNKGTLALRYYDSFGTIQIPKGTELRTADGLYKIVFDEAYVIDYANKKVTTK